MRISNKTIVILNILVITVFLLPLTQLNLFSENYSTLSLSTRGYFYLLSFGIICGLLLSYETYHISNKKNAILMFLGLFIGVLIPHHVPYNFQGNLHLLFAYTGVFISLIITYLNLLSNMNNALNTLFYLSIVAAVLSFMRYGMVTCITEVILMLCILIINMTIYIKRFRN